MEKLKNYLFYGALSKRDWSLVRDDVWRENQSILLMVSFGMFSLMAILSIYTIAFDPIYRDNAVAYGVVAAIELLIYGLTKSSLKFGIKYLPLFTFVFNFFMFAFGIALGTFLDPTSYALAFVVMIIVLPLLFCVRPIHSITSVLFVDLVFLTVAYNYKSPDIFYADVLNVVIWGIVGFFLNGITTTARIRKHFVDYRNEEAQKEIRESFKQIGTQMAMFKSLGNIYANLCYVDFKTNSYMELISLPDSRTIFGNSGGDASRRLQSLCEARVPQYYQNQVSELFNFPKVQNRLKTENLISAQYPSNQGMIDRNKTEWHELNVIAVNRDENSEVESVLYAARVIQKEKQREMEQMERLQQALAAAESANKSKTAFLNNMSHDVRTPMNAISGFTSLAQEHADEPALVREYLDKISVANKHLLSLVNNVLDMSQIESGRMILKEKAESLTSMVDELKTQVRNEVFSRRQAFEVRLNIQHDVVRCDRLRLKQVLLNLLSNAIKFTPDGGKISFEMSEVESVLPGKAAFKIAVKDTGIGMSEDFRRKIFEPFERGSVASGFMGTGLGMAISKNLMDMMGGSIFVRSALNEGTEVLLEVSLEIASEDQVEKNGLVKSSVSPGQFAGRRILVVEDNRMNQLLMKRVLKESGVEIQIAENGRAACEMLEKNTSGSFDVVLMDVQLPIMDGCEVAKFIRGMKDELLANVPIIAMTGGAFEEDREKAVAAGMNDYIVKPVEKDKLFEVLLKFLG